MKELSIEVEVNEASTNIWRLGVSVIKLKSRIFILTFEWTPKYVFKLVMI